VQPQEPDVVTAVTILPTSHTLCEIYSSINCNSSKHDRQKLPHSVPVTTTSGFRTRMRHSQPCHSRFMST